ncbi:TonB-dependent receptor [uncultured Pontibacter sp.]|uniref:TonB-dependent receptor n=1 Tax=uncultured Pontibacter sp. TaxID=453356 RepID=UPI002636EEAB|nr:TonB-dependent receptor [uncultured Pontibacter sp.]
MKSLLTILTIIATAVAAFAQQGTLKGKVTDKTTGEGIIGAVVFIKGTSKGTTTDFEGNYTLPLEAGTHTLSATFLAYKPFENAGVQVNPGQTTTLNIQLEENATQLQAVEVVGTRQTNTEMALMQDLKSSEIVVSGVSGEQIAKSLDRDAAAVVRRIPGVTVMNDRYIMIRGLSERYNTVMLNDALTPSTETDSRAFSFDILPTSVLDRILVYKSGSPELPGEFGGGVIKVYTKNFATDNTTTLNITGGHRAGTTFSDFRSYKGGKTDFLGYDDGTRTLPGAFPADLNTVRGDALVNAARSLNNRWGAETSTALPDLRMSLGLTRRFFIGDTETSNISSVSYSNTNQFVDVTRYRYTKYFEGVPASDRIQYRFEDKEYSQNVRLGIVSNWAFRLNSGNKIEFRNLFNQMGQSQVIERTGFEVQGKNVDVNNYAQRYESRAIYSGQLQGTHDRNDDRTRFTWLAGYNYTNRNEPDYKRIRSQRDYNTDNPFMWVIPYSASTFDAGRFYAELNENTFTASAQVEHQLNGGDTLSQNQPKIRAGFYTERKDRSFDARWMAYTVADPSNFNQSLLTLPLSQLFTSESINAISGFSLAEGTNPTDRYDAANTLLAGYVGGSLPLSSALNIAGGVRVEYNRQQLETTRYGGVPVNVDNPITSILPSVNATYNFSPRSLLRGGYSVSVNRPAFRELAPFAYYDFQLNAEIQGNEELTTATIHNADLRYEFYPNPTEVISIGGFYKYFRNPIETYILPSAGNPIFETNNAESAQSYGIETEIRKSFLDLSNSSIIQNTSFVLNASLIESNISLGDKAQNQAKERAMYGQSPFIVNAGLYYLDEAKDLQINLLYNVIGKRIFAVGDNDEPTVYEMPRNMIDLAVTKGFGKHIEVKAGIQDILNQKVRLVQDSNNDAKIRGVDDDYTTFKRGSYSTLGITYKF